MKIRNELFVFSRIDFVKSQNSYATKNFSLNDTYSLNRISSIKYYRLPSYSS